MEANPLKGQLTLEVNAVASEIEHLHNKLKARLVLYDVENTVKIQKKMST